MRFDFEKYHHRCGAKNHLRFWLKVHFVYNLQNSTSDNDVQVHYPPKLFHFIQDDFLLSLRILSTKMKHLVLPTRSFFCMLYFSVLKICRNSLKPPGIWYATLGLENPELIIWTCFQDIQRHMLKTVIDTRKKDDIRNVLQCSKSIKASVSHQSSDAFPFQSVLNGIMGQDMIREWMICTR